MLGPSLVELARHDNSAANIMVVNIFVLPGTGTDIEEISNQYRFGTKRGR